MIQTLTSPWFAALLGGVLYLATTLFCFKPGKFEGLRPVPFTGPPPVTESWSFSNPDVDKMLVELKAERDALATRAAELKALEQRLNNERAEISVVTQSVFRLQQELESRIVQARQEEAPNLKKLAKIHAAMSPEASAAILKEQTDDEVLKVLFYQKPDQTAPILEALAKLGKTEAQRAGKLTEKLRYMTEATKPTTR